MADTVETEALQIDIETNSLTMKIYEDKDFYIEVEESSIPWLKIFTKEPFRELSEMESFQRIQLFEMANTIEKEMLAYYQPTKINIASFANMLPRVHIHVMARFKEDSHFPNPMWGEKLREGDLKLPNEQEFYKRVIRALKK